MRAGDRPSYAWPGSLWPREISKYAVLEKDCSLFSFDSIWLIGAGMLNYY